MSAHRLKEPLLVIFYAFWECLPVILCCLEQEMRQPRAAAPPLGESWMFPAPCPGNQTFELDPLRLLGCQQQRARLPRELPEHLRAPAPATEPQRGRTSCGSRMRSAVPPGSLHPWSGSRAQHRSFPAACTLPALQSSHQPLFPLAREQKSSVGWEGAGRSTGMRCEGNTGSGVFLL